MHIRRQLAIDTADGQEAADVRRAVAVWADRYQTAGAGATIVETTGYWEGGSSTGLLITFDWPETAHEGWFLWQFLMYRIAKAATQQTLGHETESRVKFQERNLQTERESR
jgi:hypothetical protein